MVKLYAAGIFIVALTLSSYGLVQYGRALERADNAEIITELQSTLATLGLEIQKQENAAADNVRKAIESEKGRINAVKAKDHQSKEVRRLERLIKRESENFKGRKPASDTGDIDLNYRVIITNAINRVWEEGRSCGGLPASERGSVLQKRLPEVAGDDIAEIIKYAQGEYCACGLKYNALWRHAERLANECSKEMPH